METETETVGVMDVSVESTPNGFFPQPTAKWKALELISFYQMPFFILVFIFWH